MRKALISLLVLVAWAQKPKKGEKPSETTTPTPNPTPAQIIYERAGKYMDPMTQIYALYWRIATEGASFSLLDTLAQLYFRAGLYQQAIAVTEDLIQEQPRHVESWEIRALSYFYLQDTKKALEAFEKLYELTQAPQHLYQVITLQFNLQRYGECQANIERLLSLPEAERTSVRITAPDGKTQEIPLKAAALNVRGVLYRLQKEPEKAESAFKEALKVYPDFTLARGNLEDLSRERSSPPPTKR
ncbi:MAG: tetratricopeptide repeat protein [Bacteroidia bacterium]|nr:tetratricopeptide repeat protein [Bacteroidia bacterium]MDW8235819.1 tetratricopeptide repeat protein [Bacteroidia bacterium]